MKRIILSFLFLAAVAAGGAGVTIASAATATTHDSTPQIGAQVFIEPGQSDAQIDGWFRTLKESNMTLARIRMFERYMRTTDGGWDFSLFDKAFRAADKYGVELYATLFPYTDFNDTGGFKFPRSDEHADSVMRYIQNVVTHFKSYKCLKAWVLMNEPGVNLAPFDEPFTAAKYKEWLKSNADSDYNKTGYPVLEFNRERFTLWYHTWYIDRLAEEVRKYDTKSELHVNPHNIFRLYGSYDFPAWQKVLSTLGGSAHASWHFPMFKRSAYNIAMAANSEMIRSGAGDHPWLMTELQGGNNIFSGQQSAMMCPTPEETAQWLWVVMLTEGKGGIFWCLNPRASGPEAGEWAMVDFKDRPSGRLLEAAKVAKTVKDNAALLSSLRVAESGVTILFNRESEWTETRQGRGRNSKMDGSAMNSSLAWFEALSALGIQANLKEIREFDFAKSDYSGKVVILSNQWAIDSALAANLERFVSAGGKLIVDGMTGFYDYNAHCTAAVGAYTLAKLFGAYPLEYRLMQNPFTITLGQTALHSQLWMGTVETNGATPLAQIDGETVATDYKLGKGEVVWVPSLIGLTARAGKDGYESLDKWLVGQLPAQDLDKVFRFAGFERDVQMLTAAVRTPAAAGAPGAAGSGVSGAAATATPASAAAAAKEYVSVIINKSSQTRTVRIATPAGKTFRASVIYANKGGSVNGSEVTIAPEETLVVHWQAVQ